MKICLECGEELNEEQFYKQVQRSLDGNQKWNYRDSICKECRKLYTKKRKVNNKNRAIEYLGGSCKICGIIDSPEIYDFHHIENKKFALANNLNKSWENIKAELDKCILLCSNCHRKLHYGSSFKE